MTFYTTHMWLQLMRNKYCNVFASHVHKNRIVDVFGRAPVYFLHTRCTHMYFLHMRWCIRGWFDKFRNNEQNLDPPRYAEKDGDGVSFFGCKTYPPYSLSWEGETITGEYYLSLSTCCDRLSTMAESLISLQFAKSREIPSWKSTLDFSLWRP